MMRKIRLYMMGAVLALLAASCLDKKPTDEILAENAITTVDEAEQALYGIYDSFKSQYLYSGNLTLLPDIQADMVCAVNGFSNTYGDVWRWNIQPTNADIEAVYGALYSVIGRCNYFFEQVEKWENTLTDDTAYETLQKMKGNVYLARALAYSELIKCFCKAYDPATAQNELGVVLVTKYVDNTGLKRASLYDSYQFVLADLEKAADALRPDDDDTLVMTDYYNQEFFTYYTVQALYARVYLYMQEWQKAIDAATEVIESDMYVLSDINTMYTENFSYYDYMWQYDQGTEIIWKVGFTPTSYGGALGRVFLNYNRVTYTPDYVPTIEALNLYASTDMRYNSFFGSMTTGHTHGLTWPLLIKYHGNQEFITNYDIYEVSMPKVFRLSEQYLIRAEAYCRLAKYGDASSDISTLRQARYSSYGSATLTEENWLDEISDERFRELFMEGFRLNDLKRWGRGFEREPQEPSESFVQDGGDLHIEAGNPLFVWPIPQHELDLPGSQIEPNESNR